MRRLLVSLVLIVAPVTVSIALASPDGGPPATAADVVAMGEETTEPATPTTEDPTTTTSTTTDPPTTTTEPTTTTSTTTTEPSTTTTTTTTESATTTGPATTTEPATTTTTTTEPATTTTSTTTTSTTTTTTIPVVVPGAPGTLTGTPGNRSAALRWTAPASDGGAAVTDYRLERSPNGANLWSLVTDPMGIVTNFNVTGLPNGTQVFFRVRAINSVGSGPFSNVFSIVPRTVPGAPTSVDATPITAGQIRLSWAAPPSGGSPIVDYVVERSTNGTNWSPLSDGVNTSRSYTMTGLSTTGPTFFRVYAKNVAGSGPRSSPASAIARVVPSAPRILVLTAGSGQVRLTWSAPTSNGGAPVTDYVIQRSPNGTTTWSPLPDGVNTLLSYTATGLTNGTRYYFRVFAKSIVGQSLASNVPWAMPRTIASAPQSLTATPAASGQVRLSWAAPLSNGGAAVTDYVIQRSPNRTGSWTPVVDGVSTSTNYTVGGLSNGIRYYFRVVAKNPAGNGPASTVANATPRTAPSAPTVARAARGSFTVTISWGPPASTGGAAVARYSLERATNSAGPWIPVNSAIGPTIRSYTVSGLTYGRRYYFRVAASNAAGRGAWSTTVSAVPTAPATSCHPSYPTVCIPWTGADLDCGQISHRRFAVITPPAPYGRDPHGFDADRDGVGCEV